MAYAGGFFNWRIEKLSNLDAAGEVIVVTSSGSISVESPTCTG